MVKGALHISRDSDGDRNLGGGREVFSLQQIFVNSDVALTLRCCETPGLWPPPNVSSLGILPYRNLRV